MVQETIFYYRINACYDQVLYEVIKQELISRKQNSIQSWVLKIQAWRLLLRLAQLKEIEEELLQVKKDNKPLRKK